MNISGLTDEKYQGPVEQEIIGGQTAQVFTTANPLPLQNKLEESPQLQVTYSNDFSNRKNQMEIKLQLNLHLIFSVREIVGIGYL